MPISLAENAASKVLNVKLSGKLSVDDYKAFVPAVESLIAQAGKLRVLVHMHDFHGWTMGALWEDTKFELKHFRDIERLALVGDKKWEEGMATFCKPFTSATIKYFDESKLADAEAWVKS
jgi:hypothetical protein